MFEPSTGAWGRQGCTDVRLEAADRATVRGAMVLAWEGVAAKAPAKKRRGTEASRREGVPPPGQTLVSVWSSGLPGAVLVGVALATLAAAPHSGQSTPPKIARVDFNSQIRPLLSDRCFRCHGPDGSKRKAKLRLDTRDGALKDIGDGWAIVKPGQPDKSELIRRTHTDFEDDVMPPLESHLTLSEAEKALLKRWVVEGAEYKAHWSLIPVHAVDVPRVARNPIDAFVRARLDANPDRGCVAARTRGIT